MIDFVQYGTSKIEYALKRSSRKTLGISVLPSGEIHVIAPSDLPVEIIKQMILRRGSWLLEKKRLTDFYPEPQPVKELISGESFYFLGRHYRLKIFSSNYDAVEISGDRLVLNCSDIEDRQLKKDLLLSWYMEKAEEILTERFHFYQALYNQPAVDISIKKLQKRWGEFHPDKSLIVLNAELVVAPTECIDYVVIHELCHIIHPHHTAEFYRLLKSRLPNCENLKNELERHAVGLSVLG